jgi:hypothetical protein
VARARARKPIDSVEKQIEFFKVDIGRDDESGIPLTFPFGDVLEQVRQLPFNVAGEGAYLREPDGDDICVFADSVRPDALRLGRVRRSAFPMLESAGAISPLELDEKYGLFESIHVVFFRNNIVGAEYNHFAPRISRLASFIALKSGIDRPIAIRPLLAKNAAEQLRKMKAISVVDLKVRDNYVSAVREADRDVARALAAIQDVIGGEGTELEVILRPPRTGQFNFRDRALAWLVQLAERDDIIQGATKFEVKGTADDRESLVVNVLKDHLVARKRIVKMNTRSRALHDASAFAAVEEAYDELKTELERAAEVVIA